ncbi:hypothetical protein B7463_g9350, partial [Scytalidium lignicola]
MPPALQPPTLQECPSCHRSVDIASFISSKKNNLTTKRCARCRGDKRTLESLQSPTKPPESKCQQQDQRAPIFLLHSQNSQDNPITAQACRKRVTTQRRHQYKDRQHIERSITPSLSALMARNIPESLPLVASSLVTPLANNIPVLGSCPVTTQSQPVTVILGSTIPSSTPLAHIPSPSPIITIPTVIPGISLQNEQAFQPAVSEDD